MFTPRLREALTGDSRSVALIDQGVSSLTNFGLAGAGLLLLDKASLGELAILQATFVYALAVSRALLFEPALIIADEMPTTGQSTDRDTAIIASAAALAVPAALVSLAVVLALGVAVTPSVVLLAGLPLLFVQDAWRYVSFAHLRPSGALVVDLVWLFVQCVVVVALLVSDVRLTLLQLVIAWVLGGALGGVVGLGLARPRLAAIKPGRIEMAAFKPLWRGLLLESSVGRLAPLVTLLVGAALMTDEQIAEVSAPRIILGTITVMYVGLISYGTAQASGMRDDRQRFHRYVGLLRLGLVVGAGFLVLLSVLAAGPVAQWVDGIDAGRLRLLVAIVGAGTILAGAGHGWRVQLRADKRTDEAGTAQLLIGVLIIGLGTIGAIVGGPIGLVTGVAVGQALGVAVWMTTANRVPANPTPKNPAAGPERP